MYPILEDTLNISLPRARSDPGRDVLARWSRRRRSGTCGSVADVRKCRIAGGRGRRRSLRSGLERGGCQASAGKKWKRMSGSLATQGCGEEEPWLGPVKSSPSPYSYSSSSPLHPHPHPLSSSSSSRVLFLPGQGTWTLRLPLPLPASSHTSDHLHEAAQRDTLHVGRGGHSRPQHTFT